MDSKTFIVHVVIRKQKKMVVDPGRKAQIEVQSRAQVGALLFNKAPTEVLAGYSDYSNVFSVENTAKLPENTGMNKHTIKLKEDKQPPFGPIYSLGLVKLETLKTYIETNLANSFIRPFKSPAETSILFDMEPDGNLRLCVDYKDLNNITIKNRYPLPLIRESLNWLGRAKWFTKLDLTTAYYWMRICKSDK